MTYKGKHHEKGKTCKKEHKNGVTSYEMQDPDLVFKNLNIKKGDVIIDLGCGAGDYSFHAAKLAGDNGKVYPCDKWPELKNKLTNKANKSGFKNIVPIDFDLIKDKYPFLDDSADFCFFMTVLHIPIIKKYSDYIFSEIRRVLKPDGTLAILNCKKEEMPFGPPIQMRLSPSQTDEIVSTQGFFRAKDEVDLGFNYLSLFNYK